MEDVRENPVQARENLDRARKDANGPGAEFVTVIVDDPPFTFWCNKDLLMAVSKNFRTALEKNWREKAKGEIKLPDVDAKTFKGIKGWLTSGRVDDECFDELPGHVKEVYKRVTNALHDVNSGLHLYTPTSSIFVEQVARIDPPYDVANVVLINDPPGEEDANKMREVDGIKTLVDSVQNSPQGHTPGQLHNIATNLIAHHPITSGINIDSPLQQDHDCIYRRLFKMYCAADQYLAPVLREDIMDFLVHIDNQYTLYNHVPPFIVYTCAFDFLALLPNPSPLRSYLVEQTAYNYLPNGWDSDAVETSANRVQPDEYEQRIKHWLSTDAPPDFAADVALASIRRSNSRDPRMPPVDDCKYHEHESKAEARACMHSKPLRPDLMRLELYREVKNPGARDDLMDTSSDEP